MASSAPRVLGSFALGGMALAIGVASSSERGRELDAAAFRAINRRHGTVRDAVFAGVTECGSLWAAGAAASVLAGTGRRRAAARSAAVAGGTWLACQALKRAVERPRPYESDPDGTRRMIRRPARSSWPSSHPAVLAAFVTVAGRRIVPWRPARLALGVLTLAVAASRVYLGVHYPSDVASGALLGRAAGALAAESAIPARWAADTLGR
jgi:membrane-associated phospholipid phosphatase